MKFNKQFFGCVITVLMLQLSDRECLATPRAPMPPLPHLTTTLFHTRFDEQYWQERQRASLVMVDSWTLVESFSGYALQRSGQSVTPFVIPALGASNRLAVAADKGALGFWFKPYWSSMTGSTGTAKLAELIAVGRDDAVSSWSLQINPEGTSISLAGLDGSEILLKSEITLMPEMWHWVVLNYGEKTELWIDGVLQAEGKGTHSLPPKLTALVIGSNLIGTETARGEFEDVYAFGHALTERQMEFYHVAMKKRSLLGPISIEEETAAAEARIKRKAELATLAEDDGGTTMMRFASSGASVDCVTNGPVFMTNVVCYFATNNGWTVGFDIAGGTNEFPYDVFSTTNQLGNYLTNSIWKWEDVGYTCNSYTFTNQHTNQTFYILGTPQDSDGDGLSDAFEKLLSKTNPLLRDTDNDGIEDGDELSPNGIPWKLERVRQSEVVVYANLPTATEGGSCGQFRVLLPSPAPAGGVTVQYHLGGTAVFTNEYTLSPAAGAITIPAGSASGLITVCAVNNTSYDDLSRYIEITLTNANVFTVNSAYARVNIVDNDPPAIRVFALPPWVREPSATYGTNAAAFYFIRDGAVNNAVTATFAISGSATSGSDYNSLPNSILFPAGSSTAQLDVILRADALQETNETVVLALNPVSGYQLDPQNNLDTIVIASNGLPTLPTVEMTASDNDSREAGLNPGQFTFTRTGSINQPLRVFYRVSGTAQMGSTNSSRDYIALPGYADFVPNAASTNISVYPLDDVTGEPVETIVATLSAGEYTIGTNNSDTVYLDDNEPTVWTTSVKRDGIIDANSLRRRPAEIIVSRTGTALSFASFTFTITNAFGANKINSSNATGSVFGNQVYFTARQSTGSVFMTTLWSSYPDNNEYANMSFAAPASQSLFVPFHPANHLVRMDTVTNPAVVIPEGTTLNNALTFVRPYANTNSLTAYYEATGSAIYSTNYTNHTSQPLRVTFAPNQTSVSVNVQVFANTLTNGWKTGVLRFNPTNNATQVPEVGLDSALIRIRDAQTNNPTGDSDLDEDGLTDGFELANGLDPLTPDDPYADPDRDGLGLNEEIQLGTNPNVADGAPVFPSEDVTDYTTVRIKFGAAGKLPLLSSCVKCHEVSVRVGERLVTSPRVTWEVSESSISQVMRFIRGTNYPVRLLCNPYASVLPSAQTNLPPQTYTATYHAQFLLEQTNVIYPFVTDTNQVLGTNRPMVLETLGRTATLHVPDLLIATDVDGDSAVTFTSRIDRTSAEKPFAFWINEDNDVGNNDAASDELTSAVLADSANNAIDNLRDLEDLARMQFRIEGLPGNWVTNGNYQTRIWMTNLVGAPQIRLFPAAETNGWNGYATNTVTGIAQTNRAMFGVLSTGGPLTLSQTNWLANTTNRFTLPMIFEGVSTGRCVVVFTVSSNSGPALMASRPFYLDLKPVTQMYEHWTVGDTTSLEWSQIPSIATRTSDSAEFGSPQSSLEKDYVLLVHGWRMQPWERRAFASTAFKRLWHEGYRGRFGLFSWPTDWCDIYFGYPNVLDPQNYTRSERRAWESSRGLNRLLTSLNITQQDRIRLCSHSMGGVVASEALLQRSLTRTYPSVHTYIPMQAATVAFGYDAAGPQDIQSISETPDISRIYPPTGTNYYKGMAKAVALATQPPFKPRVYNFHNRLDYALDGWEIGQDLKPDVGWTYRWGIQRYYRGNTATLGTRLFLPADRYEIFAHISEAQSRALGAAVQGGYTVGGEISEGVDLNAQFGFTAGKDDHSGQFNSTIHNRYRFWKEVISRAEVGVP